MDPLEPGSQSFVVKVWLEAEAAPGERTIWRGNVTHVGSGERRYFADLADLPALIAPYLDPPPPTDDPDRRRRRRSLQP
jgi:hypothetical protein